jgi:uncharacterized protein
MVGFAGIAVAVWLALVVFAAVFQRQLIYLPSTSTPTPPGDVEEVAFTTDDALTLTAWFLPVVDPVSTVIVFPGNAGSRALRLPMARGLAERGHAVLLVDYRGYGGHPGAPTEPGLRRDATAARAHLADRDDVDETTIVYLGESIGTGVAAGLAAQSPPAALVLRSPYPELADVGRAAYPFLPVRTLLRDRYPVSQDLTHYDGPVLVVAGDADRIVPTRLSRRVARAAGADLVEIEGAGHNDPALFTGARYLDEVDAFLRAAVP